MTSRNIGVFTLEQQEKLRNSHVAVIGVGGIGSPTLQMLARIGIENLTICDKDVFEESNLNRQVFAFKSSVGERKIDAAEKFLKEINPMIKIRKFDHVDEENVEKMIKNANIIIMAADEVKASLTVYRKARDLGITVIEAFALPYLHAIIYSPDGMPWEEVFSLGTSGREISSITKDEEDRLRLAYLQKLAGLGMEKYYIPEVLEGIVKGSPSYHFPSLAVWTEGPASIIVNEVLNYFMKWDNPLICLLYTSPSPRDLSTSRMPSSA